MLDFNDFPKVPSHWRSPLLPSRASWTSCPRRSPRRRTRVLSTALRIGFRSGPPSWSGCSMCRPWSWARSSFGAASSSSRASLKFSQADTAYLVSIALLASALGTFLQCRQRGPVGSGLLSVTGTSFAFLQPLAAAGQAGGLGLMLGLSFVTAPLLIVLAPFVTRLRRVFTPLVCGIVVLLIGASLVPTAFYGLVDAGGAGRAAVARPGGAAWTVSSRHRGHAGLGRSWARIAGAALGVAAGCVVCGLLSAGSAPRRRAPGTG